MTKVTLKSEKTNLEKFYQGFPHFYSINVCENFIILKMASQAYVERSMEAARKRIAELSLPLEVIGTGSNTKTFIVREVPAKILSALGPVNNGITGDLEAEYYRELELDRIGKKFSYIIAELDKLIKASNPKESEVCHV